MKRKFLLTLLYASFFLFATENYSQSVKDLRINEVLLFNENNIVDGYNERGTWVELFNTAYNRVDISSCYLTNDLSNPKKFRLNDGTGGNFIETRSFMLFWADGKSYKSAKHMNFTLQEGDILALFDIDGNLIDSMSLVNQIADISYGNQPDGIPERKFLNYPTPNNTNTPEIGATSAEKFKKLDPYGIGMAIIAMTVVFSSLIMLYLVFRRIGLYFKKDKMMKKNSSVHGQQSFSIMEKEESGCIYAAIGLALHQYSSEMHDFEEAVLTINKVARTYSPWSSKIYSLRQTPEKR